MHATLRRLIGTLVALTAIPALLHASTALVVDAPPALAADAGRVEAVDLARLGEALARAGLALPPRIEVRLVEETDAVAREMPDWVVGFVTGDDDFIIIPTRVLRYPYDSIESVVRHEVAHLALANRAGGQALPRWFHEGVAVSVDAGFGVGSQIRLLVAMLDRPRIDDVTRMFAVMAQPEAAEAYLLSAAIVEDVRQRHGRDAPGAIAAQVALGHAFPDAFRQVTGEWPDEAAAHTWASYRRWIAWVPAVTSGSAVWVVIMALAAAAWARRLGQRRRRRRQWDDEEEPF